MLRELSQPVVKERMTAAQFFALPEQPKAELIDGIFYSMTAPLIVHERLLTFLFKLIGMFIDDGELGEIFASRTALYINEYNVLEPDIMFVHEDSDVLIDRRAVHGAPNLIVEILSQSTTRRDLNEKQALYEAIGVKEYWVIHPKNARKTTFYQLNEDGHFTEMPLVDGWLHSSAVPNFRLNTDWLWPMERFIKISVALAQINA